MLTGDDIRGVQSLYGTRTGRMRYVRKWDTTTDTWSTAQLVTNNDVTRATSTTVGIVADGTKKLLTTWVRPTSGRVYFSRADQPYATPSFVQTYLDSATWLAPAVGSKYAGTPLFVAAWPLGNESLSDCDGLRVYHSTDAFASNAGSVLLGDCTAIQPAIAYEPVFGRFILVYAKYSPKSTDNFRLFSRTSADGVNWTSAQDLGIYSTDSPDLACDDGGYCVLSYARASTDDPWILNRRIGMLINGTLTLDSWTQTASRIQVRPPVAYSNSPEEFFQAINYGTALTSLANGIGAIWFTTSTDVPFPSFTWTWAVPYTDHSPSLGGSPATNIYLVYTEVP